MQQNYQWSKKGASKILMGMAPLYGENSGFYAQSSSHLGGGLVSVVRLSVCVCVCVCMLATIRIIKTKSDWGTKRLK